MADPYIGEIRMFAGTYAPAQWAYCDGATLPIVQNPSLYSIIGTTYGGDGRNTMMLPDMTDRAPMGRGTGPGLTPRKVGDIGGTSEVTLSPAQLPYHTHAIMVATTKATETVATNFAWLGTPYKKKGLGNIAINLFKNPSTQTAMSPSAVTAAGGYLPHGNRQPLLGILFIINLEGIYPPRPN